MHEVIARPWTAGLRDHLPEVISIPLFWDVMTSGATIPSSTRAWLNATILLIASFVGVAALSLQVHPGRKIVAVAFPPWWSAQQAMLAAASADAALVRSTTISALLVVRPGEHDGLARLRKAGAWLVIDPQAVSACLRNDPGGTAK
jgi:hypothetical protein